MLLLQQFDQSFANCWFIGGFLLLAIANSVGLIPATVSGMMKSTSKFLMVTALAAIGLNTSLTDFKKAGLIRLTAYHHRHSL